TFHKFDERPVLNVPSNTMKLNVPRLDIAEIIASSICSPLAGSVTRRILTQYSGLDDGSFSRNWPISVIVFCVVSEAEGVRFDTL
ncbi:hypothetical protein, partial [Paraburkholderia caribensis]|uniref:hypothetical protein n=1 Tax=Paraburkholderia caribensis TaxID=75105 RepID=UPI0020910C53